jgi:hypothetical protein
MFRLCKLNTRLWYELTALEYLVHTTIVYSSRIWLTKPKHVTDDKLFIKLCVDLFFIHCSNMYRLLERNNEDTKIVGNVCSYSPNITESHPRRLESSSGHITLFRKMLRAVCSHFC